MAGVETIMRLRIIVFIALALALAAPAGVHAAPEPSDPAKRTSWGLYLTAREAYELVRARGDEVLFVDVRDPIEIMFTGFTDVVDVNIPFLLANRERWNEQKSVFLMERNPHFESSIARALEERGLGKDAPIILMCRSGGSRGAPSARALHGKGYAQVYVVVDGFEGGTLGDGPRRHWRLKNGWKNSGLPWSYRLNPNKIHRPR